ncbi:MAG: hypothetical protein WBP26_03480 [Candidatus Saccharimonadales bacterium]
MIAQEIRNHSFLEEWTPVRLGARTFTPQAYKHKDGRRHLYFLGKGEFIGKRALGQDVTRIGYRVWDDGTMLLGMCVAKRLRGMGVGVDMVHYFSEHAAKYEAPLTETATIHKPLVALTLKRCGFEPVSYATMAEILPRSAYDTSVVPKIYMPLDSTKNTAVVRESDCGPFYEAVPEAEVIANYPINDPSMVVALHTRYLPPEV